MPDHEIYDSEAVLVRFSYGHYDPEVGRWTSKDPIGFNAGGTNLYGYTMNDPINRIDEDGLDSLLVTGLSTKNGLPGHTSLVVDDPQNPGKFRVFDFFPTGGLTGPFGPGTARERALTASQVADLGALITNWHTQDKSGDAATISRAQELVNLAKKGDLKYNPFNINGGLNCIGFGAAAQ